MKLPVTSVLSLILQYNLYYPTLYYPNFQLSNLKSTLPTPFEPVILAFLSSDLSIIQPNCYCSKRIEKYRGSTVFTIINGVRKWHIYIIFCSLFLTYFILYSDSDCAQNIIIYNKPYSLSFIRNVPFGILIHKVYYIVFS